MNTLRSFLDIRNKCCSSLIHIPDWQVLLESCKQLLSGDRGKVPIENLYKLRILDMALDASIHLEQWEKALIYGVETLPVYRWVVCVAYS